MTKRKNNKANPPTRKANQVERERAAYWAGLYRLAQARPDRKIRSEEGFTDGPNGTKFGKGFVVHADDTERLISLLENFAKHGTFESIPEQGLSDMVMALRFSILRKSMTPKRANMELQTMLDRSDSSIRRPLARIKERFLKSRLPK